MKYKYRHQETYKDIRIDVKSNSKKDLIDKLNKKREQIDRQMIDSDISLKTFADRYIDAYKAPKVSKEWLEGLKLISDKHIVGIIGNKPIKNIKLLEVQNMLNSLDVSSNYMGKIYNLTCQIFHSAYKNGLTDFDYAEDLIKPTGRKAKEGQRLTVKEQESMLRVLPGHRAELLCKTMYFCGLRTIEARNLLWKDVDLNKKLIYVHGTKTANAERIVPIPAELLPLLEDRKGNPFDNVCISDKQQAAKAWRNVKRLMNIDLGCRVYRNKLVPPFPVREDLRLYDLRHTYCTNLELSGVPISIASRLMGHSNISITAKIYTHSSEESVEIARQLIDGKGNIKETSDINVAQSQ